MSAIPFAVATSSTASVKVNVAVWPFVTAKVDEMVGEVITAVLQGSLIITSKVTVLVADATPPCEFVIVFVKTTE